MNIKKEIDFKNRTYYFFLGWANIKNLDPNQAKIDEKSYKNVLIDYVGCVTEKNLSYVKTKSVNLLYLNTVK